MDKYSFVDNNVGDFEEEENYYYKNWLGKRYCIICNIELTKKDINEVFTIIRKKKRSKNRKFSCTKEISKYFGGRSCRVNEIENRRWLIYIGM